MIQFICAIIVAVIYNPRYILITLKVTLSNLTVCFYKFIFEKNDYSIVIKFSQMIENHSRLEGYLRKSQNAEQTFFQKVRIF